MAELIVVGGGISGLALAARAARSGRQVLLLEREPRVGGCIRTEVTAGGYWFELGAHTTYNSYRGLLEELGASGLKHELLARGPARAKFGYLDQGRYQWLTPPKVLGQLDWTEVAVHAPLGLLRDTRDETMEERFSALIGPSNYQQILKPFLSAVPSQDAGAFPARGPGSLFKTRARDKSAPRSFGIQGGLERICQALARTPGVTVRQAEVADIQPSDINPGGYALQLASGEVLEAPRLALCTPAEVSARLLDAAEPALAFELQRIQFVHIDSLGFALPRERCWLPECAFVVPREDSFFSCVTRDPFPDARYRGFAFHFRPGLPREARLARACELLRVEEKDLLHLAERSLTLPSPRRDHARRVAAIDRLLAGKPLALAGNYFEGLAIEDCVQRARSEWSRIA